MSLIANRTFLDSLQEKLSDTMPLSMMNLTMDIVGELLAGYEIELIPSSDASSSDYMLEAFLGAMRSEGLSEKTVHHYEYVLGKMFRTLNISTARITNYHIRKYFSDELSRGVADTTVRGYYWVCCSYFGWLHRDGLIQKNPMNNISKIKCQKKVKTVFSEVDIERLKQASKTPRDLVIICFLKCTGCRISEVCALNRTDIDFNRNQCVVLGKGNKERTVYMDEVSAMIVKDYLDSRTDDFPALFYSKHGNEHRFTPGGIRAMLSNLGKEAGVEHVHPHKFRRTEITHLVNRGMSIEQVKALAGHEKMDTTMQYVVLNQEDIKSNYLKYS